jgi:tetratricopeptide (TPR) repeat protein
VHHLELPDLVYCATVAIKIFTKKQQEQSNQMQSHPNELLTAIEFREVGKYKEAQKWLSGFIERNPKNAEALSLLSQLLLQDKKEVEAEIALTAAAAINSELPSVYRNQVRLLLKQSKVSEALKRARLGCKQSPEDLESLLMLAACLGANQQDSEALSITEKLLRAKPDYAEAYANRVFIRLRAQDISGAIKDGEAAVALKPHLTQMWSLLGSLHYQNNNLSAAIEALRGALKNEPKNTGFMIQLGEFLRQDNQVNEAISVLEVATDLDPGDANAWTNLGVVLQQSKRVHHAKIAYENALTLNPKSGAILNNMGIMAKEAEEWESALRYFEKSAEIEPNRVEAYNNMGNILQKLNKFRKAETLYRKAIELQPNFAEAHGNLGAALQKLNKFEEAEVSYRQAIALQPNYAQAHSNLGATLQNLGRFEEAETSYIKAITLEPNHAEAQQNFAGLLSDHNSQNKSALPVIQADKEIKEIKLNENNSPVIPDNKIIGLFHKASEIIKKHNLDLQIELSQTYRRNSVNLNCNRHKKIFNTFNVIPKFCFGCYKVQIEPRSVLELIKLFVIFDQIKLSKNNTRKCMIEMRLEISGFYKGLIYCSNLEEACQIADCLKIIIKEQIGSELPLTVKRGCSEYSIAFPDYKDINKSGPQLMSYKKDWKAIEEGYDSKNLTKRKVSKPPSLSGLSLNDVLIIRNWIDYAKGIGDLSAELLSQNDAVSQQFYENAKTRIKTHPWKNAI